MMAAAAKRSNVIRIIFVGRIEEELLDRIHEMLQSGELTHAPRDYWAARHKLERRRAALEKKRP